jgi:hypothetical protein
MKWLGYSNKVSSDTLFITAICLWFLPYSGAGEIVYWYAYKESKRDNLVRRWRRYLPRTFIRIYLESKLEFQKWARQENVRSREEERLVEDWLYRARNI